MDYSLFTPEIFAERYETIPASLRAVFQSDQTKKTLANIEREHYLNPDKSLILEQLVGLTLFGFIPLRSLSHEIGEQLFLNFEHAQVLTSEVYNRILAPYEDELIEIYKPIEEVIAEAEQIDEVRNSQPESIDSNEVIKKNEEIIKPNFFTQETKESPIKIETSEDAPLIIHEEPSFFNKQTEGDEKRPETPFNRFIPSSSESTEKVVPRAKIEGGSNPFSFLKPSPKTVIHYDEIRSGLKPEIGPESEVISVGAIDRMTERPIEAAQETPKKEEGQQQIKDSETLITIQTPEVINIAPTITTTPNNSLLEKGGLPEQGKEKKPSWISNIFKKKEGDETKTLIPEIQINEQKPDGIDPIIQGNTINLK